MERHFEQTLRDLRRKIIEMAGLVESAVESASAGLLQRDLPLIAKVHEFESRINILHKAVDQDCVSALALHQPLAQDLRLIVSIIKINADLERMGDQAVNIAHSAKRFMESGVQKQNALYDLPEMASQVKALVRDSINAFVNRESDLARDVIRRDDPIDTFKSRIFQEVVLEMKSNSSWIEPGLSLILMARNLERIGDHATNIAEDVIFAQSGQDVRHFHPKRVFIAEDETDIRDLMTLHLKRSNYTVVSETNGEAAGRKLGQLIGESKVDLAILDWMLPSRSGLELCQQFKGKVPILMVTAKAESEDIIAGLEAGADDYLTKPFEIPVLLARVKALLRRAPAATEESLTDSIRLGAIEIHPSNHEVKCEGSVLSLTVSEYKLLLALCQNRGRVLTRNQLIDQVQGSDVSVTERTVDTHIFGLRKKLGSSSELIETIRGVGYRVSIDS